MSRRQPFIELHPEPRLLARWIAAAMPTGEPTGEMSSGPCTALLIDLDLQRDPGLDELPDRRPARVDQ